MFYKILDFPVHGDESGNLIAIEQNKDIPFSIKRVYYIWGSKFNAIRGKHAHKHLEQVIICLSGSCDFILDNGQKRITVHLDTPTKGIYIKNKIWREFTNFSSDCIIVVLASEHYNVSDYIKDYNQFLSYCNTI